MNAEYRVLFEDCGGHHRGDVVIGNQVASSEAAICHLIAIGAITDVNADPAGKSIEREPSLFARRMAAKLAGL